MSPNGCAEFVSFEARSARRHSTSLPLADATALDALVALAWNQRPLPVDHGGPVRMIVPGRYFDKSVKWLTRIELRSTDRLGYWESHPGYHNRADPWLEQRFLAPSFNRREAELLLQVRNVAGRELRGLDAAGRCLTDLVAHEAVLRDSDFSRCDLRRADFSGANLSNARFLGADLRWAVFRAADVEGAD